MPNGASERRSLAAIERHIRETQAELEALERMREAGELTAVGQAQLEKEKALLEALYDQRRAILASWMPKHDPTRS
jgi:hypothetical protein